MRSASDLLTAEDGLPLFVYEWLPDGEPKAVIQIAHGMAEHAARYQRFAQALTAAGYAVYANDHRGHGKTAGTLEKVGYFADKDGWNTVVGDMYALTRHAKAKHPGLPLFLFGHSMGSLLARSYIQTHGDELAGLVCSGTGGDPGPLAMVALLIATVEGRIRGRKARSGLLNSMFFGAFNKPFVKDGKARTEFEWLSRDQAEVDKYVADPWCGDVFTAGFFADLLPGVMSINDSAKVALVPKDLPILLISGMEDPVGGNWKGVLGVKKQLLEVGVASVEAKGYPDARHEILNETNRDEVTADLIAWFDAHLPA